MNALVLLTQAAADPDPSSVSVHLLIYGLYAFVLAIFLGFEVITKVPPTLHTPLMSGANAISGITLAGALVSVSAGNPFLANLLGFLAVACATVNCVGGFMVTDRMLKMFGRKR